MKLKIHMRSIFPFLFFMRIMKAVAINPFMFKTNKSYKNV